MVVSGRVIDCAQSAEDAASIGLSLSLRSRLKRYNSSAKSRLHQAKSDKLSRMAPIASTMAVQNQWSALVRVVRVQCETSSKY